MRTGGELSFPPANADAAGFSSRRIAAVLGISLLKNGHPAHVFTDEDRSKAAAAEMQGAPPYPLPKPEVTLISLSRGTVQRSERVVELGR